MIAEVLASGAVVVGACSDVPCPWADQSVVQALAAEAGIDPAMVAAQGVEFAVGVAETEVEQAGVEGVVVVFECW